MAKQTLKTCISKKIKRSCNEVFKRSDFEKLAGYDQVGRALRELVKEDALINIGYGLYAKARVNRITGDSMVAAAGGFAQVAREALRRLKVQWEPDAATEAYLAGSLQVPADFQPVIKSRFSRKIGYGSQKLIVRKAA